MNNPCDRMEAAWDPARREAARQALARQLDQYAPRELPPRPRHPHPRNQERTVTTPADNLNEPRVANHRGFVILVGGAYRKYLSPQTARELAAEIIANADRAERTTT